MIKSTRDNTCIIWSMVWLNSCKGLWTVIVNIYMYIYWYTKLIFFRQLIPKHILPLSIPHAIILFICHNCVRPLNIAPLTSSMAERSSVPVFGVEGCGLESRWRHIFSFWIFRLFLVHCISTMSFLMISSICQSSR